MNFESNKKFNKLRLNYAKLISSWYQDYFAPDQNVFSGAKLNNLEIVKFKHLKCGQNQVE